MFSVPAGEDSGGGPSSHFDRPRREPVGGRRGQTYCQGLPDSGSAYRQRYGTRSDRAPRTEDKAFLTGGCGYHLLTTSVSVPLEPPVEFTKPLEDQTVEEETTATLECEVSRENAEVRWFREGQELRKTKKYDTIVDGRKRALIIHDCSPEDAKLYTCDAKDFKTSCFLEVTRKDLNQALIFQICCHTSS